MTKHKTSPEFIKHIENNQYKFEGPRKEIWTEAKRKAWRKREKKK